MKTSFLITFMVLLFCWACDKDDNSPCPKQNPAETKIALSFVSADTFTTHAFGTNQATTAEKNSKKREVIYFQDGK